MNLLTRPSTRFLLLSTTALLTCAPLADALAPVLNADHRSVVETWTDHLMNGDPWKVAREFEGLTPVGSIDGGPVYVGMDLAQEVVNYADPNVITLSNAVEVRPGVFRLEAS